jgi:hypothetical protein
MAPLRSPERRMFRKQQVLLVMVCSQMLLKGATHPLQRLIACMRWASS